MLLLLVAVFHMDIYGKVLACARWVGLDGVHLLVPHQSSLQLSVGFGLNKVADIILPSVLNVTSNCQTIS